MQPGSRNGEDATRKAPAGRRIRRAADAVELLRADHRRLRRLFRRFETVDAEDRVAVVESICHVLTLHMMVEEEIFYPAFLEATSDKDLFQEARVEHEGVRRLISQIEECGPQDESYAARVRVLAAMTRHHINEEEKRDGMFAEARSTGIDLAGLGVKMKARKMRLRKKLLLLRGPFGFSWARVRP
jgi:hemerythrin superfamily protein